MRRRLRYASWPIADFGRVSPDEIQNADLFYADLSGHSRPRPRAWPREDAEAERWDESGPLVEGPLTDGEWSTVVNALMLGEAQVGAPLTGSTDRDALLVAARIFCDRNALALENEDPLLCLVNDVTIADRRVRALVPHVTARGAIAYWPRMPLHARMRYAMGRLVGTYGFPVNGAAGLVGNFVPESCVIPQRLEGSAQDTPLRAKNHAGTVSDFTPEQVMQRSGNAPALAGVGLAQWTFRSRREGLFAHVFRGVKLGPAILFNMDAQLDYAATELRQPGFAPVRAVLTDATVTVERASDEVAYTYMRPGAVAPGNKLLPRTDPQVLKVFGARRPSSLLAEQIHNGTATSLPTRCK